VINQAENSSKGKQ